MTLINREKIGDTGLDTIESVLPDLVEKGPRQDILTALIGAGYKGLSFRSLSSKCGLKPTSLAYHLKVLVSRGGIRKEFRYQEVGREFSFYSLTDPGRSAVSASKELLGIGEDEGSNGMGRIVFICATAAPRLLLIKGE